MTVPFSSLSYLRTVLKGHWPPTYNFKVFFIHLVSKAKYIQLCSAFTPNLYNSTHKFSFCTHKLELGSSLLAEAVLVKQSKSPTAKFWWGSTVTLCDSLWQKRYTQKSPRTPKYKQHLTYKSSLCAYTGCVYKYKLRWKYSKADKKAGNCSAATKGEMASNSTHEWALLGVLTEFLYSTIAHG